MEVVEMRLQGLKLLKPKVFKDSRGFFFESYNCNTHGKAGIPCKFLQDNHSYSQKNTLRGLHYQSAPGQAKLIRVAMGEIFDVAVDIRPESPTFGQWEGVILNAQSHRQLFIPIGFAHGFCVLSEEAHVMYKTSSVYCGETEKGFRWNDPTINIEWPTPHPLVSERDQQAPFFEELELKKGLFI